MDTLISTLFILLLLLPFALIIIGIIRRRSNGIIFFMFGVVLLSAAISPKIAEFLLSRVLDSYLVEILVIVALSFGAYRLFAYCLQRRSRQYLQYAVPFIQIMQDPSLPSCEDLLSNAIKESIDQSSSKPPADLHRDAKTLVYRIALKLVDSPQYRDVSGLPSSTCEQLIHICKHSLSYFLDEGYITLQEFNEHSAYLSDCDQNFERYGFY